MSVSRVAWLMLAALWPIAASAQLVVRDDDTRRAANPADQVPYPAGAANCNTTVADAGARAVVRAIDSCPVEFFESRTAYIAYARQAVLGILVPGATEAAGALALDKARENALFCISSALIDESGAGDADKAFMKALVAEAKEINDRAELAGKLGELRTALKEKGKAVYFGDGETNTFVNTLDVTIKERYEGRLAEDKLMTAGRSRYDTPETRARDATQAARALGRDCRYAEAEAGLAQAQQANLAYLADLRARVSREKHFRFCIERDARQQPINELNPASPFLRHSLESADADVAEAQRRDAEQTRFIGELADLEQSFHARRNDIDALKKLAARRLETAKRAAAQCDFASADSALGSLNTETLECALQLDAERRARDELVGQIGNLQRQLGQLDAEYAKAIAIPFEQISSCGELSVFADGIDQLQGQCRVIASLDAKVAALRQRARACGDFKSAALVQDKGSVPKPGALIGVPTVTPPVLEQNFRGYTRATYSASTATWEREDKQDQKYAKVDWTYAGVPGSLSPGQTVRITITGGVTSERPKGAGDGLALAGAVVVYGDVTSRAVQNSDRGHALGYNEFVVNQNAQNVEIHLGGAPMGTGAVWKYSKNNVAIPAAAPSAIQSSPQPNVKSVEATSLTARTLQPSEDPNVPHEMGTPREPRTKAPASAAARFVGCFKDTPAFDLDGHLERSASNTPQACVSKCAGLGFRYAAVQYGQSCLCGNSYGRYGAATNCDYPCTGDNAQVCGGYNANSVYETGAGGR